MPVADPVLEVVREWVDMAESDLRAAVHLLKLGESYPTEIVCVHAHQCAGKHLKALLVLVGRVFLETHDLERPVQRLQDSTSVGWSARERAELTSHVVAARRPGSGEFR